MEIPYPTGKVILRALAYCPTLGDEITDEDITNAFYWVNEHFHWEEIGD